MGARKPQGCVLVGRGQAGWQASTGKEALKIDRRLREHSMMIVLRPFLAPSSSGANCGAAGLVDLN